MFIFHYEQLLPSVLEKNETSALYSGFKT